MTDEYIKKQEVLALKKPFPDQKGMITLYREYFIDPDAVERLPSADVRPVVHANWEYHLAPLALKCAACHKKIAYKYAADSNFCPNCGADMRPSEEPESLTYIPPEERSGVDDG